VYGTHHGARQKTKKARKHGEETNGTIAAHGAADTDGSSASRPDKPRRACFNNHLQRSSKPSTHSCR
jgi:hypothetical protein